MLLKMAKCHSNGHDIAKLALINYYSWWLSRFNWPNHSNCLWVY